MGMQRIGEQITDVIDILGQLAPVFSKVDHLFAHGHQSESSDIDLATWLPFFRIFLAVESLHLSEHVAASITSALEDNADSEVVIAVFPALHWLWLDEKEEYHDNASHKPVGSIERLLSSRQLSGRPVTVIGTQDEFLNADRRPLQKNS